MTFLNERPEDETAATMFDADSIIEQISPKLRGEASLMSRPSDVRVLLKTLDLQGRSLQFPNHGHPDNEMSDVAFDGQNAIVIMPEGDNARRQLFSAQQIVARLNELGLQDGITPDFISDYIVNKNSLTRQFAAQAYGPAPFDAQKARFVECDIPAANGGLETIKPIIAEGYAVGMRAPVKEEAILLVHNGMGTANIQVGKIARAVLSGLVNSTPAKLAVAELANEGFDGLQMLQRAIVLSFDAATGKPKPIRLATAKNIFDLSAMNMVFVNDDGCVTAQYLNVRTESLDRQP